MSVRSQWTPIRFARLIPSYTVTIGEDIVFDHLSRNRAATLIKRARDFERPVTYTLDHVAYAEQETEKCFGCLARPSLWETDCDGPYATSECGKCNWWEAVALREAAYERDALADVQNYL